MFAGVNYALNEQNGEIITGMRSKQFEEIAFEQPIDLSKNGKIYEWLGIFEQQMQISLAHQTKKMLKK